MKLKGIFLITTILFHVGLWEQSAAQSAKNKKVVFVIVDGIPADVVERVATPNIDKITKKGAYMRAYVGGEKDGYTQTPTISAVGYNSLLTGTWVNKHNVTGNDIKAPNYNYHNIFRLLKKQYPSKTIGVFSSWTDNRTKLVGDTLPQAGNISVDYRFDEYELDTARFPHDKPGKYMHLIDEHVSKSAAEVIVEKAPDLSWVYLEYTDDVAHRFGDSPQFDSAVRLMDVQIGRIWDAVLKRQNKHNEEWMIIITTDHGRDEKSGKGHGGQTNRQRTTWMATNLHGLNDYAFYYTPAIVDIMPTIAHFMKINIPVDQLFEIDGTSLIGPVSIANLKAVQVNSGIDLSWKAFQNSGSLTVWASTTNNFINGFKDDYVRVAEVPVDQQHYHLLTNGEKPFIKLVLQAGTNCLNTGLTKE